MAIIEAYTENGSLIEVTEVMLSKSGLVLITDDEGVQVALHRNTWGKLVQTVNALLGASAQPAPTKETKRKR